MIESNYSNGLLSLLEEKKPPTDVQRKVIIANAALDLITIAITTQGSNHSLAEEMENMPKYVAAIELALRSN